ncbi:MAG: CynX/NimT family MFS transporter [Arenibacterium sp.]
MHWIILFVLFAARTVMAFQFQSVAALSPFIMDRLAITLTDIGLLIGLYLGPGIIVAVAGGAVAGWFGDKRTVVASLTLMVLGGVMVAYASTLGWAIAGRVVSGIGGVVVNVLMTKMVIDWFAGRNVSTALAIFISSWPLGIALSLLALPAMAANAGLSLAWNVLIVLTVVALLLFGFVYKPPKTATTGATKISFTSLPWRPLACAALVWALYNSAFAMVFGFGALVLVEQGFSLAVAGSAISLYVIAGAVTIPLGGWLADRSGRGGLVVLASLLTGAVLYSAILYMPNQFIVPALILGGLIIGLAPGPVVAMPGFILTPEARAFGTGIFYSIYYVLMMIAPALAGTVADSLGNVSIAFVLGSVMMVVAIFALSLYYRIASPPQPARP